MKKIVLILTALSFMSCKKEYNCVCTTIGAVPTGITQSTSSYKIKDTEKKAKDACSKRSEKSKSAYLNITTTCEIK